MLANFLGGKNEQNETSVPTNLVLYLSNSSIFSNSMFKLNREQHKFQIKDIISFDSTQRLFLTRVLVYIGRSGDVTHRNAIRDLKFNVMGSHSALNKKLH
jgi:hypothetical protein